MPWPPTPEHLGATLDVVGVGEAMMLLQASPPVLIANAKQLAVDVAGAEFNVCAAVARLGGRSALLTRIGEDPGGQRVLDAMADLNLETGLTVVDSGRPTGLFLRETPSDGSRRAFYYRTGSAASAMSPSDVTRLWADTPPRAVVLSGLTAALGVGPREMIVEIARSAADHGTAVVIDVNLRPSLGSLADVIATLNLILPHTDLLALGDDESELLFGTSDPDAIFASAETAGVKEVVLKGGSRGCWYQQEGTRGHVPSFATTVTDPIGAGDAFLGGYLAARLVGATSKGAATLGSELAAGVIGAPGDTAGLPRAQDARDALRSTLERL